jgi:UDP-N-acetyl-2-amino-2-deoxyglucuronate dehydrogenase
VRWFLSINASHLPAAQKQKGQRTYRSISVGGEEVEFSDGFGELHTESYRQILAGQGLGLDVIRDVVQAVSDIRRAPVAELRGDFHPLCRSVS